eukprot:9070923-Alexandrium_andersonii.AAC.1
MTRRRRGRAAHCGDAGEPRALVRKQARLLQRLAPAARPFACRQSSTEGHRIGKHHGKALWRW